MLGLEWRMVSIQHTNICYVVMHNQLYWTSTQPKFALSNWLNDESYFQPKTFNFNQEFENINGLQLAQH